MDPLWCVVSEFVQLAEWMIKIQRISEKEMDSGLVDMAILTQTKLFNCVNQINKLSGDSLGFQLYKCVEDKNEQWKNEIWNIWWSYQSAYENRKQLDYLGDTGQSNATEQ